MKLITIETSPGLFNHIINEAIVLDNSNYHKIEKEAIKNINLMRIVELKMRTKIVYATLN